MPVTVARATYIHDYHDGLTAVGFLLAGSAMLRAGAWQGWRRLVPLTTGIWTTILLGASFTKALPTGVGLYGLFILLLGVALYTQPTPEPVGHRKPVTRATVVH